MGLRRSTRWVHVLGALWLWPRPGVHDNAALLCLVAVPQVDHEDEAMKVDEAGMSTGGDLYALGRDSVACFVKDTQLDHWRRGQWSSVLGVSLAMVSAYLVAKAAGPSPLGLLNNVEDIDTGSQPLVKNQQKLTGPGPISVVL